MALILQHTDFSQYDNFSNGLFSLRKRRLRRKQRLEREQLEREKRSRIPNANDLSNQYEKEVPTTKVDMDFKLAIGGIAIIGTVAIGLVIYANYKADSVH
ncbi:hypothetical protein [Kordia sp.]|uniref:hypothetical protein n=1 Tax=Kordia sp. TaxID=1965332 RepID=UPI003D2AD394